MLAGDWQNARNHLDVDNSGRVVLQDVLAVINDLNDNGSRVLPPTGGAAPAYCFDVDGDGWTSPRDALFVLNALNANQQPIVITA